MTRKNERNLSERVQTYAETPRLLFVVPTVIIYHSQAYYIYFINDDFAYVITIILKS